MEDRCKKNNICINGKKTKEMIVDPRRHRHTHPGMSENLQWKYCLSSTWKTHADGLHTPDKFGSAARMGRPVRAMRWTDLENQSMMVCMAVIKSMVVWDQC